MPGAEPPRVPVGLRDMMKSLTKEVLREKPPDIYEFSAQYFETMIEDKKDFEFREFEPATTYDAIFKNRERNQVPLSLVYTIIPEGLTELIKEFIKAVLRANPNNICAFAVEYFRGLQKAKSTAKRSVEYTAYENYFKSKERFAFTPYVKCTCGRTFGEGMMHGHFEKSTTSFSKTSTSVETWKQENIVIKNGNLQDTTTQRKTVAESMETVEKQSRVHMESNKQESAKVHTELTPNYESEEYVKAIFIIQRFFHRMLKAKKQREQVKVKEMPIDSKDVVASENNKQMSENTAALIIQRTLRTIFTGKAQKLKSVNVPKLENLNDQNDSASEAASYTSASTALLSAESTNENVEPLPSPVGGEEEVIQKSVHGHDEGEVPLPSTVGDEEVIQKIVHGDDEAETQNYNLNGFSELLEADKLHEPTIKSSAIMKREAISEKRGPINSIDLGEENMATDSAKEISQKTEKNLTESKDNSDNQNDVQEQYLISDQNRPSSDQAVITAEQVEGAKNDLNNEKKAQETNSNEVQNLEDKISDKKLETSIIDEVSELSTEKETDLNEDQDQDKTINDNIEKSTVKTVEESNTEKDRDTNQIEDLTDKTIDEKILEQVDGSSTEKEIPSSQVHVLKEKTVDGDIALKQVGGSSIEHSPFIREAVNIEKENSIELQENLNAHQDIADTSEDIKQDSNSSISKPTAENQIADSSTIENDHQNIQDISISTSKEDTEVVDASNVVSDLHANIKTSDYVEDTQLSKEEIIADNSLNVGETAENTEMGANLNNTNSSISTQIQQLPAEHFEDPYSGKVDKKKSDSGTTLEIDSINENKEVNIESNKHKEEDKPLVDIEESPQMITELVNKDGELANNKNSIKQARFDANSIEPEATAAISNSSIENKHEIDIEEKNTLHTTNASQTFDSSEIQTNERVGRSTDSIKNDQNEITSNIKQMSEEPETREENYKTATELKTDVNSNVDSISPKQSSYEITTDGEEFESKAQTEIIAKENNENVHSITETSDEHNIELNTDLLNASKPMIEKDSSLVDEIVQTSIENAITVKEPLHDTDIVENNSTDKSLIVNEPSNNKNINIDAANVTVKPDSLTDDDKDTRLLKSNEDTSPNTSAAEEPHIKTDHKDEISNNEIISTTDDNSKQETDNTKSLEAQTEPNEEPPRNKIPEKMNESTSVEENSINKSSIQNAEIDLLPNEVSGDTKVENIGDNDEKELLLDSLNELKECTDSNTVDKQKENLDDKTIMINTENDIEIKKHTLHPTDNEILTDKSLKNNESKNDVEESNEILAIEVDNNNQSEKDECKTLPISEETKTFSDILRSSSDSNVDAENNSELSSIAKRSIDLDTLINKEALTNLSLNEERSEENSEHSNDIIHKEDKDLQVHESMKLSDSNLPETELNIAQDKINQESANLTEEQYSHQSESKEMSLDNKTTEEKHGVVVTNIKSTDSNSNKTEEGEQNMEKITTDTAAESLTSNVSLNKEPADNSASQKKTKETNSERNKNEELNVYIKPTQLELNEQQTAQKEFGESSVNAADDIQKSLESVLSVTEIKDNDNKLAKERNSTDSESNKFETVQQKVQDPIQEEIPKHQSITNVESVEDENKIEMKSDNLIISELSEVKIQSDTDEENLSNEPDSNLTDLKLDSSMNEELTKQNSINENITKYTEESTSNESALDQFDNNKIVEEPTEANKYKDDDTEEIHNVPTNSTPQNQKSEGLQKENSFEEVKSVITSAENDDNHSPDKLIGTQNSQVASLTISELDSSENIENQNLHNINIINSTKNNIKKEQTKKLRNEPTGRNEPLIAEIHLKSFRLPEHLESIPWYEALASKEYYSDGKSDSLNTTVLPEVELKDSPKGIEEDDNTKIVLEANHSQKPIKDVDSEEKELQKNKTYDVDIQEKELQTKREQIVQKERAPTYLFGAIPPQEESVLSRRAEFTSFIIPFDNDNKKKIDKELAAKKKEKLIEPGKNILTSTTEKESSNKNKTKRGETKNLKIDTRDNEFNDNESPIELESPTKLFAELNAFDSEVDPSLDVTYTVEEANEMLDITHLSKSTSITDILISTEDSSSHSTASDKTLQTIIEVNESETPRPDSENEDIIDHNQVIEPNLIKHADNLSNSISSNINEETAESIKNERNKRSADSDASNTNVSNLKSKTNAHEPTAPPLEELTPETAISRSTNDITTLIKATLIIQKTFRGYLARKNIKQNTLITDVHSNSENPQDKISNNESFHSLVHSAIIIQKAYRGYLVRKRSKQIHPLIKENEAQELESSKQEIDSEMLNTQLLLQAAITIQKMFRGYIIRKQATLQKHRFEKLQQPQHVIGKIQNNISSESDIKETTTKAANSYDENKAHLESMMHAIIVIQKAFRSYLERKSIQDEVFSEKTKPLESQDKMQNLTRSQSVTYDNMVSEVHKMLENLPSPPTHELSGSDDDEMPSKEINSTLDDITSLAYAGIIIQKYFRGYLARKQVKQTLQTEKKKLEEFKLSENVADSEETGLNLEKQTLLQSNDIPIITIETLDDKQLQNENQFHELSAPMKYANKDINTIQNGAAIIIQTAFRDYLNRKNTKSETSIMSNENSWNESQITEIHVDNDTSSLQENMETSSIVSTEEDNNTKEIVRKTSENENTLSANETEEEGKVKWFVGTEPIVSTDQLNKTYTITETNNLSSIEGSTDDNAISNDEFGKTTTALALPISNANVVTTNVVGSSNNLLLNAAPSKEHETANTHSNVSGKIVSAVEGDATQMESSEEHNLQEPIRSETDENIQTEDEISIRKLNDLEGVQKSNENFSAEDEIILAALTSIPKDSQSIVGIVSNFLESERVYCDTDKDNVKIPEEKTGDQLNYEAIAEYLNNPPESNIPYEILEEPCIKKTVPPKNINTTDENPTGDALNDKSTSDEGSSSIEDNLQAATEKLEETDKVIEKMQQRRASTAQTSSGEPTREPSFEAPAVRTLQDTQLVLSPDTEEESEEVIFNRLQREDTRESSAQSDAVVFGNDDDDHEFDDYNDLKTSLKRVHTIAGDGDPKVLSKSVTIDHTIQYIEPPDDATATSSSSFCLDDSTSENIREKMLAYSVSEADSDYYEPLSAASGDKVQIQHDDSNINTALAETMESSTETESTIISAATKIQAGARGFLTRRRLRRISGGTKSSVHDDYKASFGNDAINESLERLIEDEAAKKIQKAYRDYTYRNKKLKRSTKARTVGSGARTAHETQDLRQTASLESSLAARRLTLQRAGALQNDSTPDDENNGKEERKNHNGVKEGTIQQTRRQSSTTATAVAKPKKTLTDGATAASGMATATAMASDRAKRIADSKLKWFGIRQNSMPVQIDSEILRVIPKHMRKRIKSAEGNDNNKKTRRRILKD